MESAKQTRGEANRLQRRHEALLWAEHINETAQMIRTQAAEVVEMSRALRHEAKCLRQAIAARREKSDGSLTASETASDTERSNR